MDRQTILDALDALNEALRARDAKAELCLYGGAAMCLVYDARPATKDVDAIFQPTSVVREAAQEVAARMQLPSDWLNDGVKGFLAEHPRHEYMNLSHLMIYVASPEYLFAMKALAARADTSDNEDLRHLAGYLRIKNVADALDLIEKYYPRQTIKPASRFFLEEIFDEIDDIQ